jgi:hypothetical protein
LQVIKMEVLKPADDSRNDGVSPNYGVTVDAKHVIPGQQSLEAWRQEVGINVEKQVKLVKLSHMRYQHKNMEAISTFLPGEHQRPKSVERMIS